MIKNIVLIFTFAISLFFIADCKKEDNNPVNDSNISTTDSDYLPISSGETLNAVVSYTVTEYDESGNVTNFLQVANENYTGTIGASTLIRNMNANPLFGNDKGQNKLIGYLSKNNSEILGFDKSPNSPLAIILPAELKVGTEWVANPQSPENQQYKIKCIESLSNFTNSAGKTFKNTINVSVTYSSSKTTTNDMSSSTYSENIDGNIYLASGIGIVGAKLNEYEAISQFSYRIGGYSYTDYNKIKVEGMLGILK